MISYLLVVTGFLALAWGAYALWRRRVDAELAEGASAEWDRLSRQEAALLSGLDPPRFARVYAVTERPRFPAYALGATSVFLLGLPFVLVLANVLAGRLTRRGPDYGEAATQLQLGEGGTARLANRVSTEQLQYILEAWAGFGVVLVLFVFWIVVVTLTMHRYHRRAPGSLREEVLRAR